MLIVAHMIKTPVTHCFIKDEQPSYNRNKKKTTRLLKKIPLENLMDLKVDYAFKQLFGNEKNKDITIAFLNAILQQSGRDRIKDASFENVEIEREYEADKQSRLDILVKTEKDELINIEIQFTDKYDMIKRSIYYWSKLYADPIERNKSYYELNDVIAINILNFSMINQTENFHTIYHLHEDKEQFKLTDLMEFHYIEMPKLIKAWKANELDPWNDVLARWLLLLGVVDRRNDKIYQDIYQELEEIAMEDKNMLKAMEKWQELSMTKEEYRAYQSRLKVIYDDMAFRRETELRAQEMIEEGRKMMEKEKEEIDKEREEIEKEREEIEKEREEMILNMLADGLDIKKIAQYTNLPEIEVKKIIDHSNH